MGTFFSSREKFRDTPQDYDDAVTEKLRSWVKVTPRSKKRRRSYAEVVSGKRKRARLTPH